MTNGVLDDGLQRHVRQRGVEQFGVDVDLHAQAIREPHLFDG